MESKKINQLATELAPELSDLTIIGDPTTGISKKITLSQMASLFTGTVEEYANLASFPLVGAADTIYIALDTNIIYRWNTSTNAYVELSPNIVTSLVFNDANGFDGTISLVGSTATLTITTALTTGSVGFIGASGALLQDNANFFWDNSNKRLGINTNAPTTALDVFGSGIIGRINGTSTNNAFLGFASAGTNKWSIGNVQSDHRFRIYSEANTSELVSVLQTGEFGIGIANPTTKLHIDGGASALIANLDANVSVAKSISFRSDNSARINLEVSGTENGSNAGANFFIRRYSDAGALIDTPLTITRSTGAITLAGSLSGTGATFSGSLLANTSVKVNNSIGFLLRTDNDGGNIGGFSRRSYWAGGAASDPQIFAETGYGIYLNVDGGSTKGLVIASTGAATFSSSINSAQIQATASGAVIQLIGQVGSNAYYVNDQVNNSGKRWRFGHTGAVSGYNSFDFYNQTDDRLVMTLASSGNVLVGGTTAGSGNSIALRGDNQGGSGYGYLQVSGSSSITEAMYVYNSTGLVGSIGTNGTAVVFSAGTTERFRLFASGNVRFSSQVYGNTVASPRTLYIQSDGELGGVSSIRESKTNIQEIDINWLMQLKPVSFNYRKKDEEGNYTNEHYEELFYGLIAEDTELINKEICAFNS